jgi:DNA-binding GntR family transcriptional regulator
VGESTVYETLRTGIVMGDFSPGEHLIEEELAARLETSRAAIRAAIVKLGHDGLVVRERHRGARVRRITITEAVQVLEVRAAIEPLAAGYAALRATDDEVEELRRLDMQMNRLVAEHHTLSMYQLNAAWHLRIAEVSRHEIAWEIVQRQYLHVAQYHLSLPAGRPTTSMDEHATIMEAITRRDRDAATAAMRLHLTRIADGLIRATAQDPLRA